MLAALKLFNALQAPNFLEHACLAVVIDNVRSPADLTRDVKTLERADKVFDLRTHCEYSSQ